MKLGGFPMGAKKKNEALWKSGNTGPTTKNSNPLQKKVGRKGGGGKGDPCLENKNRGRENRLKTKGETKHGGSPLGGGGGVVVWVWGKKRRPYKIKGQNHKKTTKGGGKNKKKKKKKSLTFKKRKDTLGGTKEKKKKKKRPNGPSNQVNSSTQKKMGKFKQQNEESWGVHGVVAKARTELHDFESEKKNRTKNRVGDGLGFVDEKKNKRG